MARTVDEFVAIRGEFSEVLGPERAGETRIQDALDAAYRQTDATIFGDETDNAATWLAAHILASDPLGKDARMIGKKAIVGGDTLYLYERQRLEALYACAYTLAAPVDAEDPCP